MNHKIIFFFSLLISLLQVNEVSLLAQINTNSSSNTVSKEKKIKKEEYNFELMQKIKNWLDSGNIYQRKQAVRKVQKYFNETTADFLKEHLLKEDNKEIIDTILKIFENRKSRKDFFQLLDFLKITSDKNFAKRVMKLLYKIHAPRLRFELKKMFQNQPWKIHSVVFLTAIEKPTIHDKKWFLEMKNHFFLEKFWISLPIKQHYIIAKKLEIFKMKELFSSLFDNKKENTIYRYYWYILSSKIRNEKIDLTIIKQIKLKQIENLTESSQRNILQLFLSLNLNLFSLEELFRSVSYPVKKFAIDLYLKNKSLHLSLSDDHNAYSNFLKKEKKLSLLYLIIRKPKNIDNISSVIIQNRCIKKSLAPYFCIAFYLSYAKKQSILNVNKNKKNDNNQGVEKEKLVSEQKKIDAKKNQENLENSKENKNEVISKKPSYIKLIQYYNALSKSQQKKINLIFQSEFMHNNIIFNAYHIDNFLKSKKNLIRKKTILLLNEQQINKFKPIILINYYLEKNRFIQTLYKLKSRLITLHVESKSDK